MLFVSFHKKTFFTNSTKLEQDLLRTYFKSFLYFGRKYFQCFFGSRQIGPWGQTVHFLGAYSWAMGPNLPRTIHPFKSIYSPSVENIFSPSLGWLINSLSPKFDPGSCRSDPSSTSPFQTSSSPSPASLFLRLLPCSRLSASCSAPRTS